MSPGDGGEGRGGRHATAAVPHRPADPLADVRQREEQEMDQAVLAGRFREARREPALQAEEPEAPAGVRSRGWGARGVALALLGLLVLVLADDALSLVERAQRLHPLLGVALGALALAVAIVLGWSLLGGLRGYLRIREQLEAGPVDVASLASDRGLDLAALRRLRELLTQELPKLGGGLRAPRARELESACRAALDWPRDNTRAWLLRYDRDVLRPIDEDVAERLRSEASAIGLLAAISPRGPIDALLVFLRQARLVRDVARAYGLRPSRLGSWTLTRQVLVNASVSAAMDELSAAAVETFTGRAMTIRFGSLIAEYVTAAALTLRLGRRAVDACRPLANRDIPPYGVRVHEVVSRLPGALLSRLGAREQNEASLPADTGATSVEPRARDLPPR